MLEIITIRCDKHTKKGDLCDYKNSYDISFIHPW